MDDSIAMTASEGVCLESTRADALASQSIEVCLRWVRRYNPRITARITHLLLLAHHHGAGYGAGISAGTIL